MCNFCHSEFIRLKPNNVNSENFRNHAPITNFYVANMNFNAICENKILTKFFVFTVITLYCKFGNFHEFFISNFPDFAKIKPLTKQQNHSVVY